MSTDNFEDSLFKGINKGHDTDTTAAIIGGLSGLYYGRENMQDFWVASLARLEDVMDLADKLNNIYG